MSARESAEDGAWRAARSNASGLGEGKRHPLSPHQLRPLLTTAQREFIIPQRHSREMRRRSSLAQKPHPLT